MHKLEQHQLEILKKLADLKLEMLSLKENLLKECSINSGSSTLSTVGSIITRISKYIYNIYFDFIDSRFDSNCYICKSLSNSLFSYCYSKSLAKEKYWA